MSQSFMAEAQNSLDVVLPDEILRALDKFRFSLLATDPLASDGPCMLLSTDVNYYYLYF